MHVCMYAHVHVYVYACAMPVATHQAVEGGVSDGPDVRRTLDALLAVSERAVGEGAQVGIVLVGVDRDHDVRDVRVHLRG